MATYYIGNVEISEFTAGRRIAKRYLDGMAIHDVNLELVIFNRVDPYLLEVLLSHSVSWAVAVIPVRGLVPP